MEYSLPSTLHLTCDHANPSKENCHHQRDIRGCVRSVKALPYSTQENKLFDTSGDIKTRTREFVSRHHAKKFTESTTAEFEENFAHSSHGDGEAEACSRLVDTAKASETQR